MEAITRIQTKFLSDDAASGILREFWKPDGKRIDAQNQAKIAGWMKSHSFDSVPLTLFVRGEQFAVARRQAVTELNLSS